MTLCNYEQIIAEETPQAKRIASWLLRRNIKYAYDVGCGPGIYVDAMCDVGINALGFDNDPRALGYRRVVHADLAKPMEMGSRRHCVLCLEVAEHMPEAASPQLIQNIANMIMPGGMLIWSAAKPGQGGDGHINCQERSYWEALLLQFSFYQAHALTHAFIGHMRSGPHMGWLPQNAMIFVKGIV